MKQFIVKQYNCMPSCVIPVYMYDHSGLTIKTTPFHCSWDSGQIGYAFITKEMMIRESISRKQSIKLIEAEVSEYDQYLCGDVWDYTIQDGDNNEVDSLCQIYGYDHARKLAEEAIEEIKEK